MTPRGNNQTSIPLPKIVKQPPSELNQKVIEKQFIYRHSEKIIPNKENIEELRKTAKNAYKPWSSEEEQRLRTLVASGETVKNIANMMGRKIGAIRSRMNKLGL